MWTGHGSFTQHLLKGVRAASGLRRLSVKLPRTSARRFPCGRTFPAPRCVGPPRRGSNPRFLEDGGAARPSVGSLPSVLGQFQRTESPRGVTGESGQTCNISRCACGPRIRASLELRVGRGFRAGALLPGERHQESQTAARRRRRPPAGSAGSTP